MAQQGSYAVWRANAGKKVDQRMSYINPFIKNVANV